jgi:hypothetical protein
VKRPSRDHAKRAVTHITAGLRCGAGSLKNWPAEVHFYERLDTGVLNLTKDFKLVFKEIPG